MPEAKPKKTKEQQRPDLAFNQPQRGAGQRDRKHHMRSDPAPGEPVNKLARRQRADNVADGINHMVGGPAGKRDAGKLCQIDLVEQHAGDRESRDHGQPDKAKPEPRITRAQAV